MWPESTCTDATIFYVIIIISIHYFNELIASTLKYYIV